MKKTLYLIAGMLVMLLFVAFLAMNPIVCKYYYSYFKVDDGDGFPLFMALFLADVLLFAAAVALIGASIEVKKQ